MNINEERGMREKERRGNLEETLQSLVLLGGLCSGS
jgi:hypothetical protein